MKPRPAPEEPEVTTMGEKGQVVIPKSIRDQLGITPKTKFVVYGQGDVLMLKRLSVPDLREEFEKIVMEMGRKRRRMEQSDVDTEIQAHRKRKRAR